jgi:hypothetical protein
MYRGNSTHATRPFGEHRKKLFDNGQRIEITHEWLGCRGGKKFAAPETGRGGRSGRV